MAFAELPTFVKDLAQRTDVAAKALEFLILTASRTGEVLGARWEEVDLNNRVWTIPIARMKGGREHRVPLATRVILILKEMCEIRSSDFVFPGIKQGRPLSNMSLLMLLRRMGRNVTAHGFRSSFRDWAAETTPFPNFVVEMSLAHAIADKTEAAYRRGDLLAKRRRLMEAWANYCGRVPADIVRLNRQAALRR
jgi:integrase